MLSRANHAPLLSQNTDGSASLVITWSGEHSAFVEEPQSSETIRAKTDKMLAFAKRKGLWRLETFSTRVTGTEVGVP